ncbi:MAG: hypothetical protein VKK04_19470 [Synechococcales bacterium]|nr:hypothetical protein [Synechococcales bacterium]
MRYTLAAMLSCLMLMGVSTGWYGLTRSEALVNSDTTESNTLDATVKASRSDRQNRVHRGSGRRQFYATSLPLTI